MSDVITRLVCPECGGNLSLWWSREDEKVIVRCDSLNIHNFELKDLEHIFLKQFYKINKYKV